MLQREKDRDRERQRSRERERRREGGGGEGGWRERILQHWASSSSSLSQKGREGWVAVGSFIWVRLEEHCQAVRLVGSPNPPSVARGPSRWWAARPAPRKSCLQSMLPYPCSMPASGWSARCCSPLSWPSDKLTNPQVLCPILLLLLLLLPSLLSSRLPPSSQLFSPVTFCPSSRSSLSFSLCVTSPSAFRPQKRAKQFASVARKP